MSAEVFNGRITRNEIADRLKIRVDALKARGITPKLSIILIGDDEASHVYVSMKEKMMRGVGGEATRLYQDKATKEQILHLIKAQGQDTSVHGVMVQLPLPGELDNKEIEREILDAIPREKDVDGLNEDSPYLSATVRAILYAIDSSKLRDENKKDKVACVVGYTGAVGRALVRELQKDYAQVLGVNSKTEAPEKLTTQADLLVTATGRPGIIKPDMVKQGAVVIDVGYPEPEVEEGVREVASFITPVPGGIGPMTVVCLIENVVKAAEKELKNGSTSRTFKA